MNKILSILFLAFCFLANAQDLSLNVAVNKNPALMGEKILVEFSIAENAKNFRGPNFKDFRILSGPNPSTSSSYSFVNGKSQSTINTTYSYLLIAKKIGKLTIGSASVNANGNTYQSNPISVQIIQNKVNKSVQHNNQNTQNISDNQLYIKAETNKRKLYQGQQI